MLWSNRSDESTVSVTLVTDEDGYLGRECPQQQCGGYFKITPGTGIKGNDSCSCPYCGHGAPHGQFATSAQVAYARSVVINQVSQSLFQSLKRLEFDNHSQGGLVSLSLKVSGHPHPIHYYRETKLETAIVCDTCTLRYAIYGVFAFCPDCGKHNSLQIFEKNLELAAKELALADAVEPDLAEFLINDALKNGVSAFDGFGREACRVYAAKAVDPGKAEKISFQNLPKARQSVRDLFDVDLAAAVTTQKWDAAHRSFQKRHLLAHKMGVVDQAYLVATNDSQATLGRKISVLSSEVAALDETLKILAAYLIDHISAHHYIVHNLD